MGNRNFKSRRNRLTRCWNKKKPNYFQKLAKRRLVSSLTFLIIAHKVTNYLGYFWMKICPVTFQNCPIWSHCSQSGRILLARESWHFSIVFVYDIVSLQMKESFRAFSDFYAGSIHFKDVRHYSIISPYKKLGCFDWRHTTDVTHQASPNRRHMTNITRATSHKIRPTT